MTQDLIVVLPEILLSVFAMAALMAGAYGGQDPLARPILWATVAAFLLLAVMIGPLGGPARSAFFGPFSDDAFARFAKVAILLSGAAVLAMAEDWLNRHRLMKFEYPILIALATVGMMVMVSAGDLITLYMGLELQSLALYVLAAFHRDSSRATEVGLGLDELRPAHRPGCRRHLGTVGVEREEPDAGGRGWRRLGRGSGRGGR